MTIQEPITGEYRSCDGISKDLSFKTVAEAREYIHHWFAPNFETAGHLVIAFDGVTVFEFDREMADDVLYGGLGS